MTNLKSIFTAIINLFQRKLVIVENGKSNYFTTANSM
jgi:hypothetical protein